MTSDNKQNNHQQMRCEIAKVMEVTSATEQQIELHDDGYWSRAYVVNGGEFVVKFPKYDSVDYTNEAKFLSIVGNMDLPVNTQKLMWLAQDNRCIALTGVRGTPLSKLPDLTTEQKQSIGSQIGAFLKQLHSIETAYSGQNLDEELLEYRKLYDDCAEFYKKHFTEDEIESLDYLMGVYLPTARKNLGERLVFSHADIWEPNILLDEKGTVGIIDCSNAGYYDEAADFMIEDETLRDFVLTHYCASENLRKKVDIKYDMSIIAGPSFGITLWGEAFIVEKWVPIIRKVIKKID